MYTLTDRLLGAADNALRTLLAPPQATRPSPVQRLHQASELTDDEKRLSGALMRVNHAGEVCTQALYTAQALTARSGSLRWQLDKTTHEETDHLAWTRARLRELEAHTSRLNPLWYAGAFGVGVLAGRLGGDRLSLSLMVEAERQMEARLASHLEHLPQTDRASRAIVSEMRKDEARHADHAMDAGGTRLPFPLRGLMRVAAGVMARTARCI